MYPNVHSNIIYNSQDMEATYVFIKRSGVYIKAVLHVYM